MVPGKSHIKYRIEYSPDTLDHFQSVTRFQQVTVLDRVEKQLSFSPDRESKNRKPMRPNPTAPWELRIGTLRVYYDIVEEPEPVVYIRAIGVKDRNRIRIGKEVISFMKTLEFSEANLPLADYARKLKKAPVIITKEGKPLAALVSLLNADMETVSLSNNPKFIALIERSRARQKKEGGISIQEMRRRLEKPKDLKRP